MFLRGWLPTPGLSDEAIAAKKQVDDLITDIYTEPALYEAIKDQTGRNALERRLSEQHLREFAQNGNLLYPQPSSGAGQGAHQQKQHAQG